MMRPVIRVALAVWVASVRVGGLLAISLGVLLGLGGSSAAEAALQPPRQLERWQQVQALTDAGDRALALAECERVLADRASTRTDRLRAILWAAELEVELQREASALDRLVAAPRVGPVEASLLDLATLGLLQRAVWRAPVTLAPPMPGEPPSGWPRFALEDLGDRLLEDIRGRWTTLARYGPDAAGAIAESTIPAAEAPTFLDQLLLALPEAVPPSQQQGARAAVVEDLLGELPAVGVGGHRQVVRMLRERAAEHEARGRRMPALALRLATAEFLLRQHYPSDQRILEWLATVEGDTTTPPALRARAAAAIAARSHRRDPVWRRDLLERHLGAPGADGDAIWDALYPPGARAAGIAAPGVRPPGLPFELELAGAGELELHARWLRGPVQPVESDWMRRVPAGRLTVELAPGRWELELRALEPGGEVSAAAVEVVVTEVGAELREAREGWEVFVYSTRDGRPIEGAEVEARLCHGGSPNLARSDEQGIARLFDQCRGAPIEIWWQQPLPVVVRHGGDEVELGISEPRDPWRHASTEKLLLATDNWIYEPGETIRALAVAVGRDEVGGGWVRRDGSSVRAELRRGHQVLASSQAQTGSAGRAELELGLSHTLGLGSADLVVWSEAPKASSVARVAIERPRRPTIETVDAGSQKVGDRALLRGRVRSLLGMSLADTRVTVFGAEPIAGAPALVRLGETVTRPDGSWELDVPSGVHGLSAQVHAVAPDGETGVGTLVVRPPRVPWISIPFSDSVLLAGVESVREVVVSGAAVGPRRWRLDSLEVSRGPAWYPGPDWSTQRWSSRGSSSGRARETVAEGVVDLVAAASTEMLRGTIRLPGLPPGSYRLSIPELDLEGEGNGPIVLVVPHRPDDLPLEGELPDELVLWVERGAPVGGTLLVGLWCAERFGAAMLEVVSDALDIERFGSVSCGLAQRVEVPVRGVHRLDGLGVRALAVRDGDLVSSLVRFDPNPLDRTLDVAVPGRRVRPGAITLEVQVGDARTGQPVSADVLVLARDRAYDLLGGRFWRSASDFSSLWALPDSHPPYRVATSGPLRAWGEQPRPKLVPRQPLHVVSVRPRIVEGSPWREGPGRSVSWIEPPRSVSEKIIVTQRPLPSAESVSEEVVLGPAVVVRREPPKTALWLPNLRTDEGGRLEVPFELPDAIGEWSVELHAQSDDLAIGAVQTVVATRRPLQVRLAVPRLLRRGDRVGAFVLVDNRTDRELEYELELEVRDRAGLEIRGVEAADHLQSLRLGPGATVNLPLAIEAEEGVEAIELTARVRSGEHADAEAATVEVLPATIRLAAGDATVLAGGRESTLTVGFGGPRPDSGADRRLEIIVWGDPAARLDEALALVAASPWGCLDELVRRAAALALLGPESGDPGAIERLLGTVAEQQGTGGALPWWPGGPPSIGATLRILEDLATVAKVAPQASELARRILPWVNAELARVVEAERPPLGTLVHAAAAFSAWPATTAPGALVPVALRERVLAVAVEQRGQLSRWGRARLALAAVREGQLESARLLIAELLAASHKERDGVVSFSSGPRDWRSPGAEPEGALAHAALLEALVRIGWPELELVDDLAGWLVRDLAANGPRCSSVELLATGRALRGWMTARGDDAVGGVVRALVGGVEQSLEATAQGVIVWQGDSVPVDLEGVVLGFDAPSSARVVAGARLEWSSDDYPTSAQGGALRVSRRHLVRDAAGAGWRELRRDDEVAVGEEVLVELRVDSDLPIDAIRLSDPRPAGFVPVDELSGTTRVDRLPAWREVRPDSLELFIEAVPAGRIVFSHHIRARFAGEVRIPPARVEAFFTPVLVGTSSGASIAAATKR